MEDETNLKYTKRLHPVSFNQMNIDDEFWRKRQHIHRKVTLQACLKHCEETGRISNFAKAAGRMEGKYEGRYFNDSDVYKVIEGISYALSLCPDAELESQADRIIDLIAGAQEENGYLMGYFTLNDPSGKWTDMEKHEMYCGGHLIEAAIAYYQATGKRKLLDTAVRLADHYTEQFGPGKKHWVEGHQEIELALIKLYRETGQSRYLQLSEWLVEERGHGYGRGEIWSNQRWGTAYCQDDVPAAEQSAAKGHAVRAMYYYSAMTDLAAMNENRDYARALDRLWDSVVNRQMYVTGGIGSSRQNEGFTRDYHLPNDTAYCETCAAIGMIYWNHRMNLLYGDAKYADIVERALYNGVLSGISLEGDTFFYVNPLESNGDHHRVPWFGTSCCPTNLARFLPSIGEYIYALGEGKLVVSQYISNRAKLPIARSHVQITQKSRFPYDGNIQIGIETGGNPVVFTLELRIPAWCRRFELRCNGEIYNADAVNGYVGIERAWSSNDRIELFLDMAVERVYAHPAVESCSGKAALQRGPLVYCLEQCDQDVPVERICLPRDAALEYDYQPDLMDGTGAIRFEGMYEPRLQNDALYIAAPPKMEACMVTAIPYFCWDNRASGKMKVWMPCVT